MNNSDSTEATFLARSVNQAGVSELTYKSTVNGLMNIEPALETIPCPTILNDHFLLVYRSVGWYSGHQPIKSLHDGRCEWGSSYVIASPSHPLEYS